MDPSKSIRTSRSGKRAAAVRDGRHEAGNATTKAVKLEQHTPGPWRFEATGCVFSATLLIAEVPMNRPRTLPDGRLIAAVPELLAALRDILRETEGCAKPCAGIFVHNALEAIAKAVGRA